MSDLDGMTAIVTGGASGLGRAIVEKFVSEGARVVIADVNRERGEALAQTLGSAAAFRTVDVSRVDDVNAVVGFTVERFGALHVMCNNAAISANFHPRLLDEDFGDFDRVIRVNLLGVMLGTSTAAQHMAKHGGGSIINTAATSGMLPGFGVACYRVAKAGVIHFSKSAAIDLASYGIRVNCIAPGNILTEMNAFTPRAMDAAKADAWSAKLDLVRKAAQPLKRNGTPEDVAQAALYLASNRSAQVTGVVLPVDGGVTIGDPVNRLQEILDTQRDVDL